MIPSSFLHDLLNRIDIIDVVGRYVQLKKSGANFTSLCPFHHEKSPSFTVSPSKQFYHCFGCGAHGTVIGFLMAHAGLAFPDAVNELAQSIGLTVPQQACASKLNDDAYTTNQNQAPKVAASGLTDMMQQACEYYRKQLRDAPHAIAYLKQRGLTGEIAARFGVGYAPGGWQNLKSAFSNYQDDALVKAGLVIVSRKMDGQGQARRHDRFRDRIIFPIRNIRGKVVGFGGRVIKDGEPKYLNSPETALFSKGNELYGLFEARAAIREKHYVLIVEGYLDVIALAQLGFPNAVATLGTACTPGHLRQLCRQTDTLIFSFDGDDAGHRAARRALEVCLPYATDKRTIRFLFLPVGHDPDTYIRQHGAQAFAQEAKCARPLSQCLLNELLSKRSLEQPEGRARALFDAKPLLRALPANTLRAQILQVLADRLKLPLNEIGALCELDKTEATARRITKRSESPLCVPGHERRALRSLIAYPRIVRVLDEKEMQTLINIAPYHELFHEVLTHAQALGDHADFKLLTDLLRNSPNSAAYEEIFQEILNYDENVRDLLLYQPASAADKDQRWQQEHLLGQELRAVVASLLHNARRERCEYLSNQPTLSPEECAELIDLQRQTAEFKKQRSSSFAEMTRS